MGAFRLFYQFILKENEGVNINITNAKILWSLLDDDKKKD